ncbi:MAG TPA: hypothetical protein DDZ51_08625 [Planctomycetaceae bacterium]|nr:hypothetical protein [Planctomycetaceae bacterium]
MIRFAFSPGLALLLALAANGQEATIKMRFVLDGPAPRIERIQVGLAFAQLAAPIVNEGLLVERETRGIQNVVVHVYTGRRGTKLAPRPMKATERLLTMTNGRYDPRIIAAQVGDTLKVVESGPNQHSANINFFRN